MRKIYGRKPVLEAISSGAEVDKIFIQYGSHSKIIDDIKSAAKINGIIISEISRSKFEDLAENKNSQGVIAIKNEMKLFSLDEIINHSKKSQLPLLLILDSIQDPHNLGAILRTAEAAGVDGIILTSQKSVSITGTVEKTSAGAVSHLRICKVGNLVSVIKQLKKSGFWIVGSYLSDAEDYSRAKYDIPLGIIIGNEEKGIRRLTAENCDFLVKIPMKGKIQSLNVSVAAGILLFEITRQRANTK